MPETGNNPYNPYDGYNPYDQDYGTPGYQSATTPVAPRPSSEGSNWISGIQWDERGRPYRTYLMSGPGYTAGQRTYVSPAEPHPSNTDDQRLLDWAAQNGRPGQSLLRDAGVWDSKKGEWKRAPNWTNIASMAVGAGIAAPFVVPAVSGLFSGAGAGAGTGALTNTAVPGALSGIAAPTAGTSAAVSSGIAAPLVNTAATGALSTIAAPALPAALSSTVPAAAQSALPLAADFTAETIGALPAATNAIPQVAAAALPGALPAVPAIRNLFQPDDPIGDRTQQPDRSGNEPGSRGTLPDDTIQGPGYPPEDRSRTMDLPFGITGRDLFNYGTRWLDNYLNNRSANQRSDASIAANREALEFAKQQYADLMRRDQERWDATEARRVPYRAASQASLAELRRMLGF